MAAKIRSLLRRLAWWLLSRYPDASDRAQAWRIVDQFPSAVEDRAQAWRLLRERLPVENDIDTALRAAFAECGLATDAYLPEFDLAASGKLHEVLYHASAKLGNPLATVADAKRLLS